LLSSVGKKSSLWDEVNGEFWQTNALKNDHPLQHQVVTLAQQSGTLCYGGCVQYPNCTAKNNENPRNWEYLNQYF
jgi:hypothetical protein